MKNVLFIEPMGAPYNIFAKFMNIPLLGTVQLATMAKKEGYQVSILNENILRRHVYSTELQKADILCLSCITATIERGKQIAKEYHQVRKQNHLPSHAIIGGIHASMLPSDPGPDFNQVVTGEAESVFLSILNGQNKNPLIKGSPLLDLDSIPIADFSLLKNHEKMTIWPIMTSRGCPYHCNFCSVTKMFGRSYRIQSIHRVIEEIYQLKKKWIFFVDDNFAAIPSRTHDLLDQLLKYRFNRFWSAQVRTDTAKDTQLIRKMYQAGCRIVFIGLESINQASLENMKKKQSTTDIIQSIKVFQNNGIQVHGMFMLGNDPDYKDMFFSTSRFCKENPLSYVQYSILTPLPGTDIYHEFEQQGRLLHKNWSFYDGLHVVFRPRNMSPLELQLGMLNCFKSFYSYSNAINDLIHYLKNRSIFTFQSFYPFFMKLLGKSVIQKWLTINRNYLKYLDSL